MSVFELGDQFWQRLKARSVRLQAADATDDQTHVHHALVTVLGFGSAFALLGFVGVDVRESFRSGIIVGWAFYALREIANRRAGRRFDWRYKTWDGICDVLVPLWVTAPIVFDSFLTLWILSAAVAVMYFFVRPIP